jgi:hypothetical protein
MSTEKVVSKEKSINKDKSIHEDMRVLKTGECQSLSGRSTLTYDLGIKNDKDVYLRLVGNSGSGIFNKEWVALAEIETLLVAEGQPITSGRLKGLAIGKSANTPGFIFAVLVNEGMVAVCKDNLRHFDRLDPADFLANIKKLIESEGSQPHAVVAKEAKPKVPKSK